MLVRVGSVATGKDWKAVRCPECELAGCEEAFEGRLGTLSDACITFSIVERFQTPVDSRMSASQRGRGNVSPQRICGYADQCIP